MQGVRIIPIEPAYKKENGMFVFKADMYDDLMTFPIAERSVIYMPPLQYGGNHSHPRTEAFIALGEDAEFHWIDDEGQKHIEPMFQDSKLQIFIVYPQTPHAIINASANASATIIEYASEAQNLEDVVREQVI